MRVVAHRRRCHERGYVLMLLLLAVSLVLIALAAGLPAISAAIRRQREEELIHRGVEYTRAIRNYYRHFRTYPASLDQLEDSNHVRFLRKRYKDPMTGSDFRLLHPGDVQLSYRHAPAALGATASDNSQTDDGQTGVSPQPFVSLAAMGAQGPTAGDGPIIGVASTSDKHSFHVFNGKDHYKDWQFVYSPLLEPGGLLTGPFDGLPLAPGRQPPGFSSVQMEGAGSGPPGTVNPATIQKH